MKPVLPPLVVETVLNIDRALIQDATALNRTPPDPSEIPVRSTLIKNVKDDLSRREKIRASQELVAAFLKEMAPAQPPTRQRLVQQVVDGLGVLRSMARQIARERPDDRANRTSAGLSLPLRLTDQQLGVVNRLLRRSTGCWEGYFWGDPLDDGACKVLFREKVGKPRTELHGRLCLAAKYLVELLLPESKLWVAVCRGPLRPRDEDSQEICGRFVVAATPGGVERPIYCSRTCQQNAYEQREEETYRTSDDELSD